MLKVSCGITMQGSIYSDIKVGTTTGVWGEVRNVQEESVWISDGQNRRKMGLWD